MNMLYVLSVVLAVLTTGQCAMLMIENKTYVDFSTKGVLMASKQMNMSIDENKLTVTPKSLMETNDTTTFGDNDISDKTLTLADETTATDGVASKRIVGDVSGINSGTLTLTVDVFTADGNLTIDGEDTTVMEGDVRVMMKLGGYAFNESSTMLKMAFMVEGSTAPTLNSADKTTDGVAYNLGGNGMIKLSKKEMVAADYKDVEPMVSDKTVTITFNKTENVADEYMYTFVLKLADVKITSAEPSSSTRVASLGGLVLCMWLLHVMLW